MYAPASVCANASMCTYTNTHMPTCFHTDIHINTGTSEDALLICWLSEFNGEPNTLPLRNSAEQQRETRGRGEGEGERRHRNKSAGRDTEERGGQKKKKKINDFTPIFEKGKCMVSAEMWPTFRCPGAFLSCAEQITKWFSVGKMNSLMHCTNFI